MENLNFQQRSDLHLARRLWHAGGVLMITIFYLNLSRGEAIKAASVAAFIWVGLDLLRQALPKLNHHLIALFSPFMRESEKHSLAGTTYLLLGVFIVIYFFPREVATLSLLFLAFADPIASYFGIRYGRDKIIGSKSFQGSLAAFAVCTLLAGGFYFLQGLMIERLLIVSLLSGLIGAVSELIPIGRMDDNFTFPIISASLLWALISLFGGL